MTDPEELIQEIWVCDFCSEKFETEAEGVQRVYYQHKEEVEEQ